MLKFGPRRLRDRIALIVLLHLGMMVALIVAFTRTGDGPVYRLPDPANVALIVAAFERTPPTSHKDLTRAFSDANRRVAEIARLPDIGRESVTPATIARYRDALGGRPFRIEIIGGERSIDLEQPIPLSTHLIRVSVALPDGRAVTIEQKALAPAARIFGNLLLFVAAIGAVDLLVVLWLASQTTRPVERLARAVREDRLETLSPKGPREIIELSGAFQQLRRQLREQIDERTRMLAAIAHDYRTYLTRLELRGEFIEDSEQRRLASKDIEEMRDLLSDTLTFARESVAHDMQHARSDIRQELAEIAAERRARGEDVAIDAIPRPLFVEASHTAIQRMLANLLDNAMRYGGGRAFVRVHTDGRVAHIFVEDEGPGVPAESLERLIEPFERLEPSRARKTGGVGLGLSIVQALAHRYQGELRIENRRKGGFRAILCLHLAREHRART